MLQDDQMIMYNLRDGIDIFHKFSCAKSAHFNINPCCSQGVCIINGGAFMAGISTKGKIQIYRTRDATLSTVLSVSGVLISIPCSGPSIQYNDDFSSDSKGHLRAIHVRSDHFQQSLAFAHHYVVHQKC